MFRRVNDFRPVVFQPHELADGIHLVGPQAGDPGDPILPQSAAEHAAFPAAPGIGVQHGGMQGTAFPVRHDEGFPEAGDADRSDIRVLGGHLPENGINAVHEGRNVDLMPAQLPANGIIPVRPAQDGALLIEHRELAAGGADIQTRDFHQSISKKS